MVKHVFYISAAVLFSLFLSSFMLQIVVLTQNDWTKTGANSTLQGWNLTTAEHKTVGIILGISGTTVTGLLIVSILVLVLCPVFERERLPKGLRGFLDILFAFGTFLAGCVTIAEYIWIRLEHIGDTDAMGNPVMSVPLVLSLITMSINIFAFVIWCSFYCYYWCCRQNKNDYTSLN